MHTRDARDKPSRCGLRRTASHNGYAQTRPEGPVNAALRANPHPENSKPMHVFPLQPGTDNVEYQGNGTWSIHHPKMINEQIENQVEGGIPNLRPGDWDSVVHTPPQNQLLRKAIKLLIANGTCTQGSHEPPGTNCNLL